MSCPLLSWSTCNKVEDQAQGKMHMPWRCQLHLQQWTDLRAAEEEEDEDAAVVGEAVAVAVEEEVAGANWRL